jgi:hypothetical protein
MHHCLTGGKEAAGLSIALGILQVDDHVVVNFIRRIKPKRGRVAQIELDDIKTIILKPLCFLENPPPEIVTDIVQFGRFFYALHT